jgi:hypothetical protein
MKKSITGVIALLAGAFAVYSQGTVFFSNYNFLLPYMYVSYAGVNIGGSNTVTTGIPYADIGNGGDWTVAPYGYAGLNVAASSLVQLNYVVGEGFPTGPVTATMENGGTDPIPLESGVKNDREA